jgi:LDH2 family malate/lactate/ureidoglycolate dehydrogenase
VRIGNGCFLLVIDIGRFQPLAEYAAQVRAFAAYLRASPKAAGVDAILLPGELEKRERQRRHAGVAIEEETWRQIIDCARRVGAALPSV